MPELFAEHACDGAITASRSNRFASSRVDLATMSRIPAHSLLLAPLLFIAACSQAPADPGPASARHAARTTPAFARPAPEALAKRSMTTARRMDLEKASRSAATPRVEDVLVALGSAGVSVAEVKQHVAAPIGALYCVGAKTAHDVALSLCEYSDEASATTWRDANARTFRAIKTRDDYVNKTTILTILKPTATHESEADAQRAVSAFARL